MATLVSIDAPHFNAGIVVSRGEIVDAAPILRWALGRRWGWFREYLSRKGWAWARRMPDGQWGH